VRRELAAARLAGWLVGSFSGVDNSLRLDNQSINPQALLL